MKCTPCEGKGTIVVCPRDCDGECDATLVKRRCQWCKGSGKASKEELAMQSQ